MEPAAIHTLKGKTLEINELFMRMLEQAPAVGILLYLAMRQQALINTVVDACMEHFGEADDKDE